MGIETDDEQAYVQGRAEAHRAQARAAADAGTRALHERFAALYAAQAASLVQDDQSSDANLLGTGVINMG